MTRILDLRLAVPAAILALPLMLVIAALLRWRLGSPVLLRQPRVGRGGRICEICKLRTMRQAASAYGCPLADRERLTPLGQWLRSASLDELPELRNVIRGDGSLVGPRPLLTEYLPIYNERQRRLHEVRPGMTGWARVNDRVRSRRTSVLKWTCGTSTISSDASMRGLSS